MRALRITWLIAALAMVWPRDAEAQSSTRCRSTETLEECYTRILDAATTGRAGAVVRSESAEIEREVTKSTVGPQTETEALSSAVRDFLPPIAAALLTPGLEADRAALTLRANRTFPFGTVQLGAEFPEPEIFAPLLQAVPQASRDAVRERLEAELDDQDDVSGSVSLNLENRWFGRSLRSHASYVSDALQALLPTFTSVERAVFDSAHRAVTRAAAANIDPARAADPRCRATDLGPSERQFDCFRPAFQALINIAYESAVEAMVARQARRLNVLDYLKISALSMLVNNQPQLNASVDYRYRDDPVGPDEVTASLRLETGWHNMIGLRNRCRRNTNLQAAEDSEFGRCIASALIHDDRMAEAIGRGQRFTLKIDLHNRAEYDFVLASEGIAVTEDRSLELDGGLAYGQYFGRLADGTRRPRIDGDVSYKHQVEGELRNDRLVAKIAFTQPLSDQLGAVFGAVWANKPEFVGEVQRRVSATLGLTYKLVQRD
jgi:hypothetical protein